MKRSGYVRGVGVLVIWIGLTGCLPIWEGRALEEELQTLRARQAEMEREAEEREANLVETIESARGDIESLEEVLEDARRFLSENSANLGADVQRMREEMSRLSGQVEELGFQFRRFQESFAYYREDVDLRFAEEFPSDPDELMARGQELEDEGDFRRARRVYERFLTRHGEHPRRNTARLKLGEILVVQEQWVNAIGEFQQLLPRESGSTESQQARASLRIGEALQGMGECEDAAIFYETVVEEYPLSDDVGEARRRLREVETGECR